MVVPTMAKSILGGSQRVCALYLLVGFHFGIVADEGKVTILLR